MVAMAVFSALGKSIKYVTDIFLKKRKPVQEKQPIEEEQYETITPPQQQPQPQPEQQQPSQPARFQKTPDTEAYEQIVTGTGEAGRQVVVKVRQTRIRPETIPTPEPEHEKKEKEDTTALSPKLINTLTRMWNGLRKEFKITPSSFKNENQLFDFLGKHDKLTGMNNYMAQVPNILNKSTAITAPITLYHAPDTPYHGKTSKIRELAFTYNSDSPTDKILVEKTSTSINLYNNKRQLIISAPIEELD